MRKIYVLSVLAFLFTVRGGDCALIPAERDVVETIDQSQVNGGSVTLTSQARLLIKINKDLLHGSISPLQAVNLRQAIDGIVWEADSYLVAGKPAPTAVLRQQSIELSGIQEQLKGYESSNPFHVLAGSAFLQDQVRSDVQSCLKQGTIVANRATDLTKNIDLISAEEAWCLTNRSGTIPEKVIENDVTKLRDLDVQIKRNLGGATTDTGL
jgi:hypothetical protein